jgi:cytochrome c biogenesis protein CcdA
MKQSPPPFIQLGRFTVTLTQALALGVVLILVGGILSVKSYQAAIETADTTVVAIKTAGEAAAVPPNIFLEAVTNSPEKELPAVNTLPEIQFDQHLAAGKPIVAFFHSNDCVQCVKMIAVVAILTYVMAQQETLVYGAALLFVYALGRGVPVVLAGTFTGAVKQLQSLGRWSPLIEKASGVIILGVGLYFLWLA